MAEVTEVFTHTPQHCLPVLDSQGRLAGTVLLEQMQQVLEDRALGAPLIAHDLAAPPAAALSPGDGLEAALQRMAHFAAEELPVVAADDTGRVIGLLSRREVLAAYAWRRLGRGDSAPSKASEAAP
jgi:CBS-domain-containing membrane protein